MIREYNGEGWIEGQNFPVDNENQELPQPERERQANAALDSLTAGNFGDLATSMVKVDEEFQCAICCEAFDDEDEVTELKCDKRHIFHTKCLKPWLEKELSCPICRAKIE